MTIDKTTDNEEMSAREYANTLSVEAMARWICLIRGTRAIFDKMEEMKQDIDFELKNKRFFNRIERCLNAYIEEQFITVKSDIENGHQKLVDTFDGTEDEFV